VLARLTMRHVCAVRLSRLDCYQAGQLDSWQAHFKPGPMAVMLSVCHLVYRLIAFLGNRIVFYMLCSLVGCC
jgi:hypothetical protein